MSEQKFNCEVREAVEARRLSEGDADSPQSLQVWLAIETPIEVSVIDGPVFTTMASPQQLDALAIGLLRGEGLIRSTDDVVSLEVEEDKDVRIGESRHRLRVVLRPEALAAIGSVPCDASGTELRQVATSGQRLRRTIADTIASTPRLPLTVRCESAKIFGAFEQLQAGQELRRITRGTHAIGLLDPASGRLISMAEDVGRHNAADKAIGGAMLAGHDTSKMVAILSSRISLEMLSKCVGAGIEIIAAVSAPTTLAIEAAGRFGVTVCASIRDGRMTIFTQPERIV